MDIDTVGLRAETPLDEAELAAAGRAMRETIPRSAHAEYSPSPGRDPLGILATQHEARLQQLVDLRVERMGTDAFSFYRGTAAIQSADLAAGPTTGAEVVVCGDAHLSNFGMFRSPENAMVFDINDFDEATVGPWEWDVKRLLCSVIVAGRSLGAPEQELIGIAEEAAASYRDWLARTLKRTLRERYFRPTSVNERRRRLHPDTVRMIQEVALASGKRTSQRVARRALEDDGDGGLRFVDRPPVLQRAEPEIRALADAAFHRYRETVPPNVALLLSQYRLLDVARRVVGVGSVGTRCFILALRGPAEETLILQLKEAGSSVVEQFGGVTPLPGYLDPALFPEQQGYRVVACQRILQAVSDPFLGFLKESGFTFYLRLFRNRNASFEIPAMNSVQFRDYARICAVVLARAHARSPKAAFVSGYLGTGDSFPRAVARWSSAYADQAEEDYAGFVAAARDGRFTVAA
ncbi:DUF2252 domain-containing protein [Leifsonia aquatica]|uniref:Uncharacterized protein (DUF2252 family) n=3 Tax=Leifsonia aquatica TaxID=144185 RepID=A0A7W4UTW0_LEIAQ|nr:DUF2252 domain-containing protein [Leifsonia aquatica]MBB2965688.1 uncharacterized protein (DUF2252 family) [Leifsonia aquatica]